jgi:hypothetical protein
MKKRAEKIWITGMVWVLFLTGCSVPFAAETVLHRAGNTDLFVLDGIWTRRDGDRYSNFYFQLTRDGDTDQDRRYTVSHLDTEVHPAAEKDFAWEHILDRNAIFLRCQPQASLFLLFPGGRVRCPKMRFRLLDADHMLLTGETLWEGIYTRQKDLPPFLQYCSDLYLKQLNHWVFRTGQLG